MEPVSVGNTEFGTRFPYSIPRQSGNILLKEQPHCSTQPDQLNGEIKVETIHKNVSEPQDAASSTSSKSFVVRPNVSTGRLLYNGADYQRSGYGFGKDVTVDTSTLTRREASFIKKKLRDWTVATRYRPSVAETSRFNSSMRSKCVGFITGFTAGYFAVPFIHVKPLQGNLPRRLTAVFTGIIGSTLLSYWIMPAVYVDVLQLNTPMGYKSRQFLYELREIDAIRNETRAKV